MLLVMMINFHLIHILISLQIHQGDLDLKWLSQVYITCALASQYLLALEEILGVEVELLLLKYHLSEVEWYHMKQCGNHAFKQIVQFKIVEPLFDNLIGLDE